MNSRSDFLFAAIPGACIVIDPTAHMINEQSATVGQSSDGECTTTDSKQSSFKMALTSMKSVFGFG